MPENVMLSVRNILEESIVVSGKCVLDARPDSGGVPKNQTVSSPLHATPSYVGREGTATYVAPIYIGVACAAEGAPPGYVGVPLSPPPDASPGYGETPPPPGTPSQGGYGETPPPLRGGYGGGAAPPPLRGGYGGALPPSGVPLRGGYGGALPPSGVPLRGGYGGGAAPPSPTVLNCFSCDHDYRIYRRVVMDCCGKGGCLKCLGMWFFHYGKNCPFCNSEKAVRDDTNKIVEISSDIERIILDVGANPVLFEFLGNTRPSCGAPLLPQTYSAPLNNVQRRNAALLARLPLAGARRKRFGPMCTWYLIFALLLILITIGAIVSAAVIVRIWV